MIAFLAAFASTFVSVFALGLQSLNVNQRMYFAAALTSVAISTGHIWLYKVMPTATGWDVGGYYLGGISGITASIWFHARVKAWLIRSSPMWKAALHAACRQIGLAKPSLRPSPACGRCGDESPFQCHRGDCPRNEVI